MAQKIYDEVVQQVLVSATHDFRDGKPYYWITEPSISYPGWIKIQEVTIRVSRPHHDEILRQQVAAFEEEIQKVRAEAETKVKGLEEKLSNLLALGYDKSDNIPF